MLRGYPVSIAKYRKAPGPVEPDVRDAAQYHFGDAASLRDVLAVAATVDTEVAEVPEWRLAITRYQNSGDSGVMWMYDELPDGNWLVACPEYGFTVDYTPAQFAREFTPESAVRDAQGGGQ